MNAPRLVTLTLIVVAVSMKESRMHESKTDQCVWALSQKLKRAESSGAPFLDVRAADLHREVWGASSYPAASHRMPVVCGAMEKLRQDRDVYLCQTPSGTGARLEIRYMLPR